MAVSNDGPRPKFSKRRKIGKNKKRAWRTANVDDIEEFLADERRQIRTGGLVAEKTDASLFVLDKGGVEQSSLSKKRRKDKALKCLSLLQPSPFVKPVRVPDNENFQRGKRTRRVLERVRDREQSALRQNAKQQRKKDVEKREQEKQKKRKLPEIEGDLWADDEGNSQSSVKRPKGLHKKPNALKATVIPHPGSSVNPSFDDHQDLLLHAHTDEVKKDKAAQKIHNALDAMFPSKEEARINEADHLKDMASGLFDASEDESSEDGEEDVPESFSVGAPVRREDRKTRKQRRVENAEKSQLKEKTEVNDIKKRENMILRIPTLKAEINKMERKKKQRAAQKKIRKEGEKFKTKRLNTVKFEEPDVDLKLSSELVASLREVKPEGHLMKDVYKSLQRRNIIEPRVRQKNKRKYRPKVFEKKGHKAVVL